MRAFLGVVLAAWLAAGPAAARGPDSWFFDRGRSPSPAPPVAGKPVLSLVDLRPMANWRFDHMSRPPTGTVTCGAISFHLLGGARAIFQSQHHLIPGQPTEGRLSLDIPRPTAVHVLINGAYVEPAFRGKKVGEILLTFSDGYVLGTPLVAWRNLRETWAPGGAPGSAPLEGGPPPAAWQNVRTEKQERGARAAMAFMDMVTIPIFEPFSAKTLSSITFRDTSTETLGSQDPSLVVMAVTVASRP